AAAFAVQLRDVLRLGAAQLAGDEVAVVAIGGIGWLVVAFGLSCFLVGFAKARILDVGVHGVGQRAGKHRLQQMVLSVVPRVFAGQPVKLLGQGMAGRLRFLANQ